VEGTTVTFEGATYQTDAVFVKSNEAPRVAILPRTAEKLKRDSPGGSSTARLTRRKMEVPNSQNEPAVGGELQEAGFAVTVSNLPIDSTVPVETSARKLSDPLASAMAGSPKMPTLPSRKPLNTMVDGSVPPTSTTRMSLSRALAFTVSPVSAGEEPAVLNFPVVELAEAETGPAVPEGVAGKAAATKSWP
jgi:nitrogen fixation protein